MSEEQEAYNRAFHCGAGGHDGHPEGVIQKDSAWTAFSDRCYLAVAWKREQKEKAALRAEVERMRDVANLANKVKSIVTESDLGLIWLKTVSPTAANAELRATLRELFAALTPTSPGLPEGEKDEPCFKDAAGWCSTHTRYSDMCKPAAPEGEKGEARACKWCGQMLNENSLSEDQCASREWQEKLVAPKEDGLALMTKSFCEMRELAWVLEDKLRKARQFIIDDTGWTEEEVDKWLGK